jgi:AcrR family transcriptional regulator
MSITEGAGATRRLRGRPANTPKDVTVEAVLVAARRLFAAKGYAGTTNRQVAAAAGLAHTAIYNHFGSKAQLFTAVFVDVQERLIAELDRPRSASPDDLRLPVALLDAVEALRAVDPSYVEFLASMYVEVRRHPELEEIFRDGADTFPVVARLQQLSGGRSDEGAEDHETMWFWIALALGLAQLSVLADAESFAATVSAFRRRLAAGATSSAGTGKGRTS